MRTFRCFQLSFIVGLVAAFQLPVHADTGSQRAIEAVIQRYAKAWFEGNPEALRTTVTPQFARQVITRESKKLDRMHTDAGLAVIDETERGYGRLTPIPDRDATVRVLGSDDESAVALLKIGTRSEYLDLVMWQGEWRITHALTSGGEQ